jgi:hypothetical protein
MPKNTLVAGLALSLLGATSGQALAEEARKQVIARAFAMTSLTLTS